MSGRTTRSTEVQPLPCHNKSHVYDRNDFGDRYYDSSREHPWTSCESSPCPNRNFLPLGVPETNWAVEIDPSQIPLIAAYHRGSQEAVVELETTTGEEPEFEPGPEEPIEPEKPVLPSTPPNPPSRSPSPSESAPDAQDPDSDPDTPPPPGPNPPNPPLPAHTAPPVKKPRMVDIFKAFQDVPKLQKDGSNYRIWVERVNFTAMGCGVKAYLTSPAPADKENESNALLAALMSKLPDAIFITLKSRTQPRMVMEGLKTRFGQHTAITEAHAEERLFSLKCTDGSPKSVQAHLDELLTLKDELAVVSITISDKTFTNAIISSMPGAYKSVILSHQAAIRIHNTINPSSTETMQPDQLISLLRAEAQSHAILSPSKSKKEESAHFAGSSRGRFKKDKGKPKGDKGKDRDDSNVTCYKCQGKGHRANVCPSKGKAPRSKDQANVAKDAKKKDDKPDDKGKGKAVETATVVQIDTDDEGWMTDCTDVDGTDSVLDCSEIASMAEAAAQGPVMEIYDSGATKHMTPYRDQLLNYRQIPKRMVKAAGKSHFAAYGIGDMVLRVPNGPAWGTLNVSDVLYAPAMGSTLISTGRLDDNGYWSTFGGGKCVIKDRSGKVVADIAKTGALYKVYQDGDHALVAKTPKIPTATMLDMHKKLGHASYGYIKKMVRNGSIAGFDVDLNSGEPECDVCLRAKAVRAPVASKRSNPRASEFGAVMHMDVWGPAPVQTIHHSLYTCTFLDDATLWLEEPLLRTKDELFPKYVGYEARLFTQHGVKIKVVHSDRGGEFLGNDFTAHLERQGTIRKLTVHNTPEHNGDAERSHLTMSNMRRCMLISSGLPRWLWGEAHQHAVWLWNRTPHAAIGFKTPYEVRFGKRPDLSGLKPFGSICYVKRDDGDKLGARAEEARWLGFDSTSNGIQVYWPVKWSITVERNIVVSSREIPLLEGENYGFDMPPIDSIDNEENLITHDPIAQPPSDINPVEEIQEPVPPGVVSVWR